MTEAPRERPATYVVLHSFSGHVKARPQAVFDTLDKRLRPSSESESRYLADSAAFLIIAQGGWWYRGEYRVVPDEYGSNIEHVMLNIAQNAPRLGWLSGRRVIAEAPSEFKKLVRELRLELE